MFKIGYSHDIHKVKAQQKPCDNFIKLGNYKIKSPYQIIANSDGDILTHAVVEAIFGALNIGSLGEHFADKAPLKKEDNAEFSQFMLKYTRAKLKDYKFKINNIDSIIIFEWQQLSSFRLKIQHALASTIGCNPADVSVKFTRSEKYGEDENTNCYLQASAVVLLSSL